MINSRFLNYKYYNSFIRDLNDNQIPKDAIVFIQDESHTCIWTHGKEYLCNAGDIENYCDTNIIPLFNNYYTKQWIDGHYQPKPANDSFATKNWCNNRFVLRSDTQPTTDDEPGGQTTPPDTPYDPQPSNTGDGYRHVFLEQEQYDNMSSYDSNTIYFIYEESEQSGTWVFGDKFPITLTDGTTNGIGQFPINLT